MATGFGVGSLQDEPLQAVRVLYFKAGETGIRWIDGQVTASDLM